MHNSWAVRSLSFQLFDLLIEKNKGIEEAIIAAQVGLNDLGTQTVAMRLWFKLIGHR